MMLRIALVAIVVASITGVVALTGILPTSARSAPSATRSIDPISVAPGDPVTVTITPLDYGLAGGVTETLPNGFAYVSSDLSPSQVTELSGSNQVRFTLLGETSFYYTVTASASITAGSHTFSGTLRDFERDDYLVRGASSCDRFRSSSYQVILFNECIRPGDPVTVTITPLDYGLAGGVTETLPNGFAYVSSDLSPSQVTELSGSNQVRFTLLGETSFYYTVTASASITAGSHTFSGTLRDFERDDYLVRGASSVRVEAPSTAAPRPPGALIRYPWPLGTR